MNSPEASSAAARLCAQCGMCCNGAMFHTVQLQPGDSAKALAALGLKLKRKQGRHFIQQPCPAFQNSQCSIYAARPERCRRFECQQLKRLAAGAITEAMAVEKIHLARQWLEQIDALLQQTGKTNFKHPLTKRCEKSLAEPIDLAANPEAAGLRRELTRARQEFNALLNDHFRIIPSVQSSEMDAGTPEPALLPV